MTQTDPVTNYGSMSVEEATRAAAVILELNNPFAKTALMTIIQAQVDAAYQRGKQDAMQWQPIETAPKDGTPILLYVAEAAIEGFWDDCLPAWNVTTLGQCTKSFYSSIAHWMPLAKPPKENE